jgi:hypothetical protein
MRKVWIKQIYVFCDFKHDSKSLKQGFQYKDIVVLTRKESQGIAIANYEQGIPLLSSETLMIQNATEVRLIIFIEIL